jgi:phosphonoacetate hydrolase
MIEVNGRRYPRPRGPAVVICLDGCEPAYLDDALSAGLTPHLSRWKKDGTWRLARGAMPSFTNPNNVSIVTGAPPSVHGISGNHFYDEQTRTDVPMNARAHVRVETILEAFAREQVRVLSVTAKRKLVDLISPGGSGRAYSAEQAGVDVYSPEASYFVLDQGVNAIGRGEADLVYLSTTDYVQHKHPPGSEEARAFYRGIDQRLGRLDALGATVAVTADHGMNDKTRADGSPNVVYLASLLDGSIAPGAHVTLPITDPYVVHHGALGGCAMVYLGGVDRARARTILEDTEGVERVLSREEAAVELMLPADRIGDLVVLAEKHAVLGKRPEDHDLSHVERGLRSHGGMHETLVPLILNRRVEIARGRELHNYDVFELALTAA